MSDADDNQAPAQPVPPEVLEKVKRLGLCPYCASIQDRANIRFDPVPNTENVVLKFLCINPQCCAVLGFQVAAKSAVGLSAIERPDAGTAGDVRDILANIRNRKGGA